MAEALVESAPAGGYERSAAQALDVDRAWRALLVHRYGIDADAGLPTFADGANPFATLAAPGGPAPAGSSLLAVLANYVLPGGGLPTSTLFLFVQLAVILAAFSAPRLGTAKTRLSRPIRPTRGVPRGRGSRPAPIADRRAAQPFTSRKMGFFRCSRPKYLSSDPRGPCAQRSSRPSPSWATP